MPALPLVSLPEYRAPNALNLQPINDAISFYTENKRQNALLDLKRDAMGLEREKFGLEKQRFGMEQEKHGVAMRTARTEQDVAEARRAVGALDYIDSLPEQHRAAAWQQTLTQPGFRDLPPQFRDYGTASRVMRAKAAEYISPKDRADIDYKGAAADAQRAHGRYYDAAAGAKTQNADSVKMNAYAGILKVLGGNPSREMWERENQPGGIIHSGFGGPIPYERAPYVLAQARNSMDQFEPTEEDRIAGITRENKIKAFRQQRVNEMYGVKDSDMAKKGVQLRPDGSFEAIPGSQNTVGDRQARIVAKTGMQNLEEAEKFFKEPGTLGGGIPGYVTQGMGQLTGQGDSGRAFKAARMGIIDLNFALSGKSVSNAERTEFLSLYLPHAGDTQYQQLWKIERAKAYFNAIIDAREGGASDEDVADIVRRAINDGTKGPGNSEPPKGQRRHQNAPDPLGIR